MEVLTYCVCIYVSFKMNLLCTFFASLSCHIGKVDICLDSDTLIPVFLIFTVPVAIVQLHVCKVWVNQSMVEDL